MDYGVRKTALWHTTEKPDSAGLKKKSVYYCFLPYTVGKRKNAQSRAPRQKEHLMLGLQRPRTIVNNITTILAYFADNLVLLCN